jgi:putative ABC transport system permease protein
MLNLRGRGINSPSGSKGGEALPAFAAILISLLTLPLTTTCGAANHAGFDEPGQVPAAVPMRQAEAPGQLVALWSSGVNTEAAQVSPPDFNDWRNQNKVFEHMAAFAGGGLTLRKGGRREGLTRTSVSSGFFEVLGVRPYLGRVFAPGDEEPGRDDVVILGYALWQRAFGSDPGVVGRKVAFDDQVLTVVGVMPKGFEYPGKSDLPPDLRYQSHTETWTPLPINSMQMGRGVRCLSVIARTRPGVTVHDARKEMEAIAERLRRQNPQTNEGWGVRLVAVEKIGAAKSL